MNPFKAPSFGGGSFAGALAGLQQSAAPELPTVSQVNNLLDAKVWHAGEIELICVDKRRETHDVVTLVLQARTPVLFHFKPGQFVTLGVEIGAKSVWRSYTISSSPSRPYTLDVTVKKVTGGLVSNYLVDSFIKGDLLRALPPAGAFNLADFDADKCLLLSAGSGITPMMSMTAFVADTHTDKSIAFVHSARSGRDIIFEKRLRKLAGAKSGLQLAFVLEEVGPPASEQPSASEPADIAIREGRLDWPVLISLVPDAMVREVFVCGPEGYMQSVKAMFEKAGFDMSRYHQESFVPPSVMSLGSDASAVDNKAVSTSEQQSLTVSWGKNQTKVDSGSTVLDAAEDLELPIITACRAGVCGACKCKVVKGEVSSASRMTLTDEEVAAGVVLACASTLHSDAELALL